MHGARAQERESVSLYQRRPVGGGGVEGVQELFLYPSDRLVSVFVWEDE